MMEFWKDNRGWILISVVLAGSFGYLLWSYQPSISEPNPLSATQKSIPDLKGFPYYELNMESEVPLTTGCEMLNEMAIEKFQNYLCTESDDKILSDWSCVRPAMADSPTREFVEVIQGDMALCQKKLEDFRDQFQ